MLITPELRVVVLTKTHVGSGNEIVETAARVFLKRKSKMASDVCACKFSPV